MAIVDSRVRGNDTTRNSSFPRTRESRLDNCLLNLRIFISGNDRLSYIKLTLNRLPEVHVDTIFPSVAEDDRFSGIKLNNLRSVMMLETVVESVAIP